MTRVRWFVLVIVACAPLVAAENASVSGQKQDGFLLPNGWTITPAGEQVLLKDLPLNIVPLSDGRHALVATSGYNAHELTLVDLESKDIKQTETVRQSWFGLAVSPNEDKLWWSGGGGAALHVFGLKDGKLARADNGDPTADPGGNENGKNKFRSGLALDNKTQRALFARYRRRTIDRHRFVGQRNRTRRWRSAAGRTTWRSPAMAHGSMCPIGRGGSCWRSIPTDLRVRPRSALANILIKSPSARRTIGFSWPAPAPIVYP